MKEIVRLGEARVINEDSFNLAKSFDGNYRVDGEFIPCIKSQSYPYNEDYLYRPYNFSLQFPYLTKLSKNQRNPDTEIKYPYNPYGTANFLDNIKIHCDFSLGAGGYDKMLTVFRNFYGPELPAMGGQGYYYNHLAFELSSSNYCNAHQNTKIYNQFGHFLYDAGFVVTNMEMKSGQLLYGMDGEYPTITNFGDYVCRGTMSFEQQQADPSIGKMVAKVSKTFHQEVYRQDANGMVEDICTIEFTIEALMYYAVPACKLELSVLNEDKEINKLYFGEDNQETFQAGNYNYVAALKGDALRLNYIAQSVNAVSDNDLGFNELVEYITDAEYALNGELLFLKHTPYSRAKYPYPRLDAKYEYENNNINSLLNPIYQNSGIYPFSFGVKGNVSKIIIPKYSLDLVVAEDEENYFINIEREYVSSNGDDLFIVSDGIYSCLMDVYNKKAYFILRDGAGYYDLDLNNYSDILDFFGYDGQQRQIYLGKLTDAQYLENEYKKLSIYIQGVKRKPQPIIFDFKKLNFSIFPCQTACMGKGGILSKV